MAIAVKAGKVYGLRKMSNIDNIKNYTVIDLEMTGLSAKNDKIIEIGAARVRGGEIVDTVSTLVNPKQHIPQRVQELTGITDSDVENAADMDEAVDNLLNFIGDDIILGQNVTFDYSFLKKAAVNNNLVFPSAGFDKLKMARRILPELEHKKLDYLSEYLKVDPGNSHRALDDALSASGIYWKMYTIKPDDSGFEIPSELVYSVKKDSPITQAQRNYLTALVVKHNVKLDIPIDEMTKSIDSRNIDKILSEYGK